jgi:hypothetical protein
MEVGALSESSGSGSGGASEDGSASASSTSAGTTTAGTSTSDTESSASTTDAGTDAGTGASDATETGGSSDGSAGSCLCGADEVCGDGECFGGQVFVNFDGPVIVEGAQDDAAQDQTAIGGLGGDASPFGGTPQQQAALLEAVRGRFVDVSLWVTDVRPTEGDYAMVVLGDNLDQFGGVLEISTLNCDHENPRAVAFAALHAADGYDDETRATVVAHAIGHSIGLEHVSAPGAIMGPTIADPQATFDGGCQAFASGPMCGAQHLAACPGGGQDSLAELQALFGAP